MLRPFATSNIFAGYAVAIVMSRAGMNDYQRTDIKNRLKLIGQMGGADPDGLRVVVPTIDHHNTKRDADTTERLLGDLLRIAWLRIEVAMIADVEDILREVALCDEVWCVTAKNQSDVVQRPKRVHAMAQALHHDISRRFKLIPFWLEPRPEPPKPPMRQRLRNWR